MQRRVLHSHEVVAIRCHLAEPGRGPKAGWRQQDVEPISPPLGGVTAKGHHRSLCCNHRRRADVGGPLRDETGPRFDVACIDGSSDFLFDGGNTGRCARSKGRTPCSDAGLLQQRRRSVPFNNVTERLESSSGGSDGIGDLWIDLGVASYRMVEEADPERSDLVSRQYPVRRSWWGSDDAVTGPCTHRGIEDRSAVTDAVGHHVLDAVARLVELWAHRDTTSARLEPDQAAQRSRDPDGATSVACVRSREHPCGDCRCCATRRASRTVVEVPRISAGAVGERFGCCAGTEFGRVGAAERDEACGPVCLHEIGIASGQRSAVLECLDSLMVRSTCLAGPEVLHEHRYPGEGSGRQPRLNLCTRLGVVAMDDGVDLPIDQIETLDRRFEHLGRCHIASAYGGGERNGVEAGEFFVHRGESRHWL